ncbi:alanine--glyoxylate aminotransferase 2, mitochondrial [Teleopsis dalmanni]|uniref:alanine--glyoxylate aminotransferase 2, mitochondrial n=1 Tax=Teleopsis dalmanni TaxID=139649 RepID=UPI000D32C93A|nr:alanine--glyoxylate aminotransferase 2, mitochondrial-like isoform X2 [Teleopsis dalmanni]XP_037956656.1 alanine--glyoxylate aminotransferase 2, mitochondrial [Teleopsis dalmanni]
MAFKNLYAYSARFSHHGKSKRFSSTLHSKVSPAVMPVVQNEMPHCDFKPPQYTGPSYENIKDLRKNNLTPNLAAYYKKPLLIHSGHMQWLFDHEGRRYLDMFGGIVTVSVGHCHPKVNKALEEQINTLWHTTNIYMHPKIHEYAKRLTDKLPGDLKCACFVNSGSEANDLAMLIARMHTGNNDIITLRNSYHGMSPYTMGLTAHSTWRFPLAGVNSGILHVMQPDPYLGIWGGSACRDSPVQTDRSCACNKETGCVATDHYYNELEETFKYSLPRGKVAAMFAESIQGVGGTVQFPKGYIKKAAELIRANGGLFVSDEVQTGFGRTGEHFWGFEGHGIIPDIVTMAKGIGNGFPMAAVVTTPKIAESLSKALHFNTYGGNPMASAVGIAVLDVIKDEGLQQNSLDVGTYFLKSLAQLKDQYEIIGDVRGKGLMIGVELVADRKTKTPLSAPHVMEIWETCKDMGVLYGKGGLHGNVLRIKPPMCINKSDVKFGIDVLSSAISEFLNKKR